MRNRYILVADLFLIAACALGAFVLRLDWFFFEGYEAGFLVFLAVCLLVKPPAFFVFGLYRRYWRYASTDDLMAVLLAVSAGSVVVAAIMSVVLLTQTVVGFPRSVFFIDWLLTLACATGVRLSVRLIAESKRTGDARPSEVKRVLVAGAGDAGTLVVREMLKNRHMGLVPVGFLDDDPRKQGKQIHGVRVLGPVTSLAASARRHSASEIIIAMPRAGGSAIRRVLDECRGAGITARALPGLYELIGGRVSIGRLREVEIADLLRREQVTVLNRAAAYLRGCTVLVTGAGGSIGFELCKQAAEAGAGTILMLGHGENSIYDAEARLRALGVTASLVPVVADIRNPRRLRTVFERFAPQVVFHAAAHKHVPLMEAFPEEAVTNNVGGTRNLLQAAHAAGVERLVLVSTDKAVAPRSVMGATKRLAEMLVRDFARQTGRAYMAVRFGNVLGSRGSVVPGFKRQIERGGPITITHPEMRRFFMTIPEAVHLVLEAGGLGGGGELFVLEMGKSVRIVDLAQDLVRLSGLAPDDIEIRFTGLRPGEKLEESLYEEGARLVPTENPDVSIVHEPGQPDPESLGSGVDALLDAAFAGDCLALQAKLADVLPTFVPLLSLPGSEARVAEPARSRPPA
jgi:FlaA1/EpsC-like NDP-sugar epimerase